jgi:hypothetical protein
MGGRRVHLVQNVACVHAEGQVVAPIGCWATAEKDCRRPVRPKAAATTTAARTAAAATRHLDHHPVRAPFFPTSGPKPKVFASRRLSVNLRRAGQVVDGNLRVGLPRRRENV